MVGRAVLLALVLFAAAVSVRADAEEKVAVVKAALQKHAHAATHHAKVASKVTKHAAKAAAKTYVPSTLTAYQRKFYAAEHMDDHRFKAGQKSLASPVYDNNAASSSSSAADTLVRFRQKGSSTMRAKKAGTAFSNAAGTDPTETAAVTTETQEEDEHKPSRPNADAAETPVAAPVVAESGDALQKAESSAFQRGYMAGAERQGPAAGMAEKQLETTQLGQGGETQPSGGLRFQKVDALARNRGKAGAETVSGAELWGKKGKTKGKKKFVGALLGGIAGAAMGAMGGMGMMGQNPQVPVSPYAGMGMMSSHQMGMGAHMYAGGMMGGMMGSTMYRNQMQGPWSSPPGSGAAIEGSNGPLVAQPGYQPGMQGMMGMMGGGMMGGMGFR